MRCKLVEDESKQDHIQGGRAGDTTYTYYNCPDCDALWTKIRDSGGLGGHGSYWHEGHMAD